MDERGVQEIVRATHWPRMMGAAALGMLAIFLFVLTISTLQSMRYIGVAPQTNMITVEGTGEVVAVPDVATFTVTVQNNAADVQTAQTKTTNQGNTIVDYLKSQGIADTDIQTSDYSIQPQYQYQNAVCAQPAIQSAGAGSAAPAIYCPPGRQTLTGYQVSETLTVKVRDTSKAGAILAGVGSKGASGVSGLSFTVSNEDALQQQARDKAISQAEGNARDLAKALGVQLVGLSGFQENNNYPNPVAYATMSAGAAKAPSPDIQTGQNKVTDSVTLTYDIR